MVPAINPFLGRGVIKLTSQKVRHEFGQIQRLEGMALPRGGRRPPRGLGRGGSPKRLHKAPTDKTKPQQTKQSPDKLYKAPERLNKDRQRLYTDIQY